MFLTGADIVAIRRALCMTQQAFADSLGVTDAAVCLWEWGDRRPRYPMMEKLCKLAELHGVNLPSLSGRQLQPA